jgi:Protein of unknown function (DUF3038)
MMSIQQMPASTAKWDDLVLNTELDRPQLERMAENLETIAIALVALTQIGTAEIDDAARDLHLEASGLPPAPNLVSEWIESWSSRLAKSRQQLDVKELRVLVLVISRLAEEYQTLIRRNISYWEQTIEYRQLPLQSPSLADYISNFIKIYQDRGSKPTDLSIEDLSDTALGLTIELLFYSSAAGHKRLWNALLQRSDLPANSTAQI